MEHLPDFVLTARQLWRGLMPGAFERRLVVSLIVGVFCYLVVLLIERTSGTRTDNYRSRGFVHDIAYYVFYRGGVASLLVPAALVTALHDWLSFLDFRLLVDLPYWLQLTVALPIVDLVGYWLHRAYHQVAVLWAFHSTHHSQEHLTFATYTRVHPVEDGLSNLVGMALLVILGINPRSSFLVSLTLNLIGHLQHTHIPWRFGPLRWILVTPPYHRCHHSAEPWHSNRNFGVVFSFWDRLFGTAVCRRTPAPIRFGLEDVRPTSLLGTLMAPARVLDRIYGPAWRRALSAAARVTGSTRPGAPDRETIGRPGL